MNPLIRRFGLMILLTPALTIGCAAQEQQDEGFYTSGNREADQRAEQRIAKVEQARGAEAEGADKAAENVRKPLYDRLGGEQGIRAIVDDFVNRALADPRVNWQRSGVTQGGLLRRDRSVEWQASSDKIEQLKKHMTQFLALATGGPAKYEGREMKQVHEDLKITNAEFDAAVGDLKATLDRIGVPTEEQKELLSIVESTRPQVVEVR